MTKKPPIDDDDLALWQHMTRDVERAEGKDYLKPHELKTDSRKPDKIKQKQVTKSTAGVSDHKAASTRDLDKRTRMRLRKGQLPIEARLDLHGLSQTQAYESLLGFVKSSYGLGRRCVLVITGRGLSKKQASDEDWLLAKPGVLKTRTPDWLGSTDFDPYVLEWARAKKSDGGEGALYVYLRRKRG